MNDDKWATLTNGDLEMHESREAAEAYLIECYTEILLDHGEAMEQPGLLLEVVGSTVEIVGAERGDGSERGEWLRERGLDYEVTGYRISHTSLHAEALAAAGVDGPAMSDRELAVLLLDFMSCGHHRTRKTRAAQLAGVVHNCAASLLRAAQIDPDEETGWDGEGDCPLCGSDCGVET